MDKIRVTVQTITNEAKDVLAYELIRTDGEALPEFEPGAHIDLFLPNDLVRQYSLANLSDGKRYLIGVFREPDGRGGSAYIHDKIQQGDELDISVPRNNFPLIETSSPIVLIAGGIGVTPILSMVKQLQKENRDWTLYYCARSRERLAFLKDLEVFQDKVIFHLDDEAGGPPNLAQYIDKAPKDAHLYCCGPLPMLSAFESLTEKLPSENVHVEYFVASEELSSVPKGAFEVELAKSGHHLIVKENEAILEVVERAGLDVPFSCRMGICGECETRVLEGTPDHRDAVLTPDEKALNQSMMICCSRALTERLVLDI